MRPFLEVVQEAADLHRAGNLAEAANRYEHLIGAVPDDPVALYLYGTLHSQLKQYGTAILMLEKSLRFNPDMPEAWHNLGVAYRNEGHTQKARAAYKNALKLKPDDADVLAMMSGSYVNTGAPAMAIEWADKVLRVDRTNPHARNHKALALLELGRFAEAWPYYGSRFDLQVMSAARRPFTCPAWDGKPTKKLAIHGEQGLGDEIMFMSCFHDMAHLAGEIVIECAPRLVELFSRSFGVECVGTFEELPTDCTAHVAMGDLPKFCRNKAEDFPGTPYLKAKTQRDFPGFTVGIAWHGGTKGTHQELRNPPLEEWRALMDAAPASYISLQYGEDGARQAAELGIPHDQERIDDIDKLTSLIAACDLVISPCQTAIHIAGALGTECWCLTPSSPAWRYGIDGPMLWYDSVKLYRQKGSWADVFSTVRADLANHPGLQSTQSCVA